MPSERETVFFGRGDIALSARGLAQALADFYQELCARHVPEEVARSLTEDLFLRMWSNLQDGSLSFCMPPFFQRAPTMEAR